MLKEWIRKGIYTEVQWEEGKAVGERVVEWVAVAVRVGTSSIHSQFCLAPEVEGKAMIVRQSERG